MRNHFLRAAGVPSSAAYVTDNLIFHVDFENTDCYSGSGTNITCLAGKGTKSIEEVSLATTGVNHLLCTDEEHQGPAFFAVPTEYDDYSGSETLTDDFIPSIKADGSQTSSTPAQTDFSVEVWLKIEDDDWFNNQQWLLSTYSGSSSNAQYRSWYLTAYRNYSDTYRRLTLRGHNTSLRIDLLPVSYTHLTLPTIYSV